MLQAPDENVRDLEQTANIIHDITGRHLCECYLDLSVLATNPKEEIFAAKLVALWSGHKRTVDAATAEQLLDYLARRGLLRKEGHLHWKHGQPVYSLPDSAVVYLREKAQRTLQLREQRWIAGFLITNGRNDVWLQLSSDAGVQHWSELSLIIRVVPFGGTWMLCHNEFVRVLRNGSNLETQLIAPFINAKDKNGWTALHYAALEGDSDAIEMFIQRNADIHARTSTEKLTPLLIAAREGHPAAVQSLLKNGANIEARSNRQMTPFHLAIGKGHSKVVEVLFKRGADIKARALSNYTPLHVATMQGRRDLVDWLLEHEADANVRTSDGKTALDIAKKNGHAAITELLNDHNKSTSSSICHIL